jgi:hypothetical protein
MGTMDNVIAKEELLDGPSSFKVWRDVVENVFLKEDLWDLLDPDDSDDSNSDSDVVDVEPAQSLAERKLLRRRKARAAGMLKLTVSPRVLTFIREMRDPAIIWTFLNAKYNTHTIADAMALRNKWAALRMTDNIDVGTFMHIVSETLNDLRSIGVIVDNDTAVHKILTELPQKFEIFVRTLQQETIIPTLDNLGSRLHLEESNIKLRSGHGSEEALVMRFRSMVRHNQFKRRSSGAYGGTSNQQERQPYQARSLDQARNFDSSKALNPSRPEIFCFRCNKPGHIA